MFKNIRFQNFKNKLQRVCHKPERSEFRCDGGAVSVVVGTAFTRRDEPEPSAGRLLVFEVVDRVLELRHEAKTKGAVYSLEGLDGRLLAGVNNKLQVFEWVDASLVLRAEHR